jgi:predicted Zn-dependent protease
MNKILIKGIGIIALFFFTWFALSEVDWMTVLRFEKVSKASEEKIGELFWDVFNKTEKEIKDEDVVVAIDSLLDRICESNYFDKTSLKVHIVKNEEVNAFALPNEHLVIYTGLLTDCENESELAGVICHELAHIRLNHVMKKLGKEIGLTALISISTGNSGSEVVKEAAKLLSSTAYDRKLEKEADIKAVDYLINARINSEPFAAFLSRLSENETDLNSKLSWISTHPDSKERADYILEYRKSEQSEYQPVLSLASWDKIKTAIRQSNE